MAFETVWQLAFILGLVGFGVWFSHLSNKLNRGLDEIGNRGEDLDEIRRKNLSLRGSLLEASDWTQLPDSPLSDSKKAEWAT